MFTRRNAESRFCSRGLLPSRRGTASTAARAADVKKTSAPFEHVSANLHLDECKMRVHVHVHVHYGDSLYANGVTIPFSISMV